MNSEASKTNEVKAFKTYIAWCERNEKTSSFFSIIITLVIQFKPTMIHQHPGTNFFWQILIILATVFFECTFLFCSQIYFTKRLLYHNSSKEDEEFRKSFTVKEKLSFKLVVVIAEYVIFPLLLIILLSFSLKFNLLYCLILSIAVLIATSFVLSFWTSNKKLKIYNSFINITVDKTNSKRRHMCL